MYILYKELNLSHWSCDG